MEKESIELIFLEIIDILSRLNDNGYHGDVEQRIDELKGWFDERKISLKA